MSYCRYATWIAACCWLLVAFGCQKEDKPIDGKLRIGILYTADVLPLKVAEAEGYFLAENANVELVPFQSAMERDSAFAARQLDGMTSDLVGTSLMRGTGVDLRVVLLTSGTKAGVCRMAILASPGSDIFRPDDLRGRPVAMSSNSVVEYVADQLLSDQGFAPDDIRKSIVSKIPIRLNMLIEGQVPAAILPDPMAAYAEAKGARLILDDREEQLGHAVLAFRSDSLGEKNGEIRKLLRAVERAAEVINSNPAAYQELLSDVTRTPSGVKGGGVVEYPVNKVPSEKDVARVQQWLRGKGILKGNPNYTDIVTDEFVR